MGTVSLQDTRGEQHHSHNFSYLWSSNESPNEPEPYETADFDLYRNDSFVKSAFFVVLVAKLYSTVYNPMDYSPPGSSVHGIFQARILEWVTISFSRGSSRPRDRFSVSCTGRFFTTEFLGKPWAPVIDWRFRWSPPWVRVNLLQQLAELRETF